MSRNTSKKPFLSSASDPGLIETKGVFGPFIGQLQLQLQILEKKTTECCQCLPLKGTLYSRQLTQNGNSDSLQKVLLLTEFQPHGNPGPYQSSQALQT